jgi:hypothetical protein
MNEYIELKLKYFHITRREIRGKIETLTLDPLKNPS